ncbi:MAG: SpoIIE family protein phosphatase [Kordiimonadaceae bacterium]|nr:SpoIIE family protein phosphatase [Kordiimonadaceae bacterium]MBO6569978.1 SpoIIE family protein phosphatase [Kordiimonadaceae bacterium]MBO6965925.1 SpoIIE family protein phosphatase [Kordiimonadaceae bacterium]
MLGNSPESNPVPGRNKALPEGVSSAHILVVDDMPLMRKMIGMCLERGGFHNISFAEDGDEALDQIAESQPDLVILDLNMPRVSGYDVCKQLRADDRTANLPILVQSASETAEERVEVFAVGATDFVSKPINHPELLARVCMHLENRFLIRSLSDFQDMMQSELKMAREMQHSLLPETQVIEEVETVSDAKIEAFYKASFELGGDLWGTWPLPGNKLGIYVLDVTGHGVGAALNTFSLHATMARFEDKKLDPAAFMDALNSSLVGSFQLGRFATMFYAVLDCQSHELLYAGAGAPRPIIFGANGSRTLDSSGLPIAIVKSATYENKTDRLEPGESLFCYSDVLVEAEQPDGSMLGEEGLVQWIEEASTASGRGSSVKHLLDRFYEGQDENLPDDLTAVAIHRNEGSANSANGNEHEPSKVLLLSETENTDLMKSLVSPGLDIIQSRIGEYTAAENFDFSAVIIDGADDFEAVKVGLALVDDHYVERGGPVVVALKHAPEPNDPILSFDRVRYCDVGQGVDGLRRLVAEEADDFIRICALRAALEADHAAETVDLDGTYRFASRREAQKLAMTFSQASTDPVPLAIGLSELFLNAIEHGCLEIGHNEKGELIENGRLNEEIIQRRRLEKYRSRFATVIVTEEGDTIKFRVEDPGNGFDYSAYLEDDEGHSKKHGRGIAMAKGCFQSLTYLEKGNIVEAEVSRSSG